MRTRASVPWALAALVATAGTAARADPPATQPPTVSAVAAEPDRARPRESGGRDSAATVGPLAIGAAVKDPTGVELGHIALLTTDKSGRSVAKVRQGETVLLIPTADLFVRRGETYSRLTLDALKRDGDAIAAGP